MWMNNMKKSHKRAILSALAVVCAHIIVYAQTAVPQ